MSGHVDTRRRGARRCGAVGIAVVAAAAAACGPTDYSSQPWAEPGELTLVGDTLTTVTSGETLELAVRYADDAGDPLAGVVEFEIIGNPRGARLSSRAATTDSTGTARVTLDTRNASPGPIQVDAGALDAGYVTWEIEVEEAPPPLDSTGTYELDSQFELVLGPQAGEVGETLRGVLEATQRPGPTLLDRAAYLGYITHEEVGSAESDFAEFLAEETPDAVAELRAAGDDFADASLSFSADAVLEIDGDPDSPSAEHEIAALEVVFADDRRERWTLEELGLDAVAPKPVSVAVFGRDRLSLTPHAITVPYGAMVRAAADAIAGAEPGQGAEDLADLLEGSLDCVAISEWFSTRFNMDPIVAEGACFESRAAVADQVLEIDTLAASASELVIGGEVRLEDEGGDGVADVLADGLWSGSLQHGGETTATLDSEVSAFSGQRALSAR